MIKKLLFLFCVVYCFSCEELIEVEDISNDIVLVLAPVNDVVLNTNSITFSWDTLEFAESYRLQIARPDFELTEVIVEDTIVSTTNFNKTLTNGEYQWRVKAINSGYETPYTTQNLTIEE
tara:strand:+ start:32 stop:391 length:360 start_codon:yes stop_codon:yes gene_type:complete